MKELEDENERLKGVIELYHNALALLAHDINNNVATALGYMDIEIYKEAEKQVQKIPEITKTTNEFFKDPNPLQKRKINLDEKIEKAWELFTSEVKKSLTIHYPTRATILGNSLFTNIAYNLIQNAAKAGAKDVWISVQGYDVIFKDNGEGIKEETKKKIMAKTAGEGLRRVMNICEVFGWSIKIESKKEETYITITTN